MKEVLEYKGYRTKSHIDFEDNIIFGKIEGINDLVDFDGETIEEFIKAFHESVDNYLDFCNELGKEPEKEYKGQFNVRIMPELHKKLALYAINNDISLNAACERAIDRMVNSGLNEQRDIWNNIVSRQETLISKDFNNSNVVQFQKFEEGALRK